MQSAMSYDTLLILLEEIKPVDLKGVELLRQLRSQTGTFFPGEEEIPAEAAAEAAEEMITYAYHTHQVIRRLSALRPVPLERPLLEFSL